MSMWTYKIMARFKDGRKWTAWEEVDSTDDKDNSSFLLGEYRMAYGADADVKSVRRIKTGD